MPYPSKFISAIFACAVCLFLLCAPSFALQLSKSLSHYADEMEFYYQKPRPEMIPGLLNSLDKSGQLAKGENRLMTAAFLSELCRAIDLDAMRQEAKSREIARVLAWCAHLAQNPAEKNMLKHLAQNGDSLLASQIAASPAPLAKWNPLAEKAALQMYWGAFMASGGNEWLDAIIRAALAYARAAERGALREPEYVVGQAAAASLYEFAPRHPAITARLKNFANSPSKAEREMIGVILSHAKK